MITRESIFTIIAFIYFFVNAIFLPHGLLYTIFLSPLFYLYLVKLKYKNVLGYFLITIIPLAICHYLIGAKMSFYLKSSVLIFSVYLFVFAFYAYLRNANGIERLFARLAVTNFILTLLALIIFWTDFKPHMWYLLNLNMDIKEFPRLKLFTYEPSYYSTLLVPILTFYFLTVLIKPQKRSVQLFMLVLVSVPLVLSFSLGVMSGLAFAFGACIFYFRKSLFSIRYSFYNLSTVAIILGGVFLVLIIFYPSNPLFARIIDIFEGKDTSAKGRTTDALMLSWQMLDFCNCYIGCGLGQIKVVGEFVVRKYYNYQLDDIPIITIPSAIGETLASFGVGGVVIRVSLLFYLYFQTKAYTNYYRFTLFWYMFLYQFTGSYLTNIAEYVVWVFAFTPHFRQFDLAKKSKIPAA